MKQGRAGLTIWVAVIVVLLGLLAPDVSQATLTGTCGSATSESAQLGVCRKSLTISDSWLTILLMNTSPASTANFIVADTFNLPTGVAGTLFGTADPDSLLERTVSTLPFDNDFNSAAGSSTERVGVEQTAQAVFSLSSSGVNETDVFNSELVRVKGVADGGSDKTDVQLDGQNGAPAAVPEPMTLLLIGPGMAGFAWLRHKRRRSSGL